MSDTTRVKRRESTRVRRASAQEVVRASVSPVVNQEQRAVRPQKVAAAKKKIESVGYDLESDFRKAMSKLLEDFGA